MGNVIDAVKEAASGIWNLVADVWGIFRAHPGILLVFAAFLGLLAWSTQGSLSRTCSDIEGIFYNQRTGAHLTYNQSMTLLERLPSLRPAVDRCRIELSY